MNFHMKIDSLGESLRFQRSFQSSLLSTMSEMVVSLKFPTIANLNCKPSSILPWLSKTSNLNIAKLILPWKEANGNGYYVFNFFRLEHSLKILNISCKRVPMNQLRYPTDILIDIFLDARWIRKALGIHLFDLQRIDSQLLQFHLSSFWRS